MVSASLEAYGLVPLAEMRGELAHASRGIPLRARGGEIRAFAMVDAEDYERFVGRRWHLLRGRGRPYANRKKVIDGRECALLLHREILGLVPGDPLEGDHRNRDTLDNRRANLRVVTRKQQLQNVSARGGVSKYRGVSRWKGKWTAQARLDGKQHKIGYFDTEQEAADAAARWREQHMPFSTD